MAAKEIDGARFELGATSPPGAPERQTRSMRTIKPTAKVKEASKAIEERQELTVSGEASKGRERSSGTASGKNKRRSVSGAV